MSDRNKIVAARSLLPFSGLAFLLIFVPTGIANEYSHNDVDPLPRKIISVPPGQVINGDYFALGESVEISGTVNGDVYAAGGTIIVDGTVNGDLLAAGGTITISGTVSQDVRAVGGQVSVSGELQKNLTAASGNIELEQGSTLHGNMVAGAGNTHLAGLVKGDVKVAAGNLVVSNTIRGHLHAAVSAIRLTSKAQVARNVTYWSHREASIDDHASIHGVVKRKPLPLDDLPSTQEFIALAVGATLVFQLANFLSTFVLGMLIMRLYPKLFQQGTDYLQQQPLSILGLGVLGLLLTPLLIGLLGMTVLGLPLALFFLAVFLIYLYLSRLLVIAWAGQRIFAWFGKEQYHKWAFVIGLLLYFFLSFFPIVGSLLTFFTILFGLGTIFFIKKEYYTILRDQGLI